MLPTCFARRSAGAGLLAWFLLLTGCSGERPIVIGVAGALSTSVGQPMHRAAVLAVEEINAAGGVNGRPLALLEYDDFADPDSAVRAAEQLYGSEAVAVIGHLYSRATMAAAPIYNGGNRPLVAISPASSSPAVTDAGPWIFRLCPSDLAHGAALARWAAERLQYKRAAVLYHNDEYGRGVRRTFVDEFRRRGGELVSLDPYLGEQPDVVPFVTRIAQQRRTEFLVLASGTPQEAAAILRAVRGAGITLPVVGGDGVEGLEQSGAVAEGTYVSTAYHPAINSAANRRFLANYYKRWPEAGAPNLTAAATYDGIHLLARVIAESGPDRAAIRRVLAMVGTDRPAFEGASGRIAFDEQGDVPKRQVYVTVIRGGEALLAGAM